MKTINEHIRKKEFQHIYLLYGEEAYLRHQYRDKLKQAICPEGDEMNISRFQGKSTSVTEVLDLAETLPFFAERRLIIIENSGWFKSASEGLPEKLKELPDTTYLIFVEEEVDKRGKLYKTVSTIGYATEMSTPNEKSLLTWIVQQCAAEGKQMEEAATRYLLQQDGANMNLLQMELEKIFSYTMDRDQIRLDDVKQISSPQVESQVFAMLDAMGSQDQETALRLYQDLLELREPPLRILALITRQINILLQVKELLRLNQDNKSIASKAGIPPFTVGKYKSQCSHFSYEQLRSMLEACQDTDAGIKRSLYQDKVGVELLIIEFSSAKQA